jgi:hypothetical protein
MADVGFQRIQLIILSCALVSLSPKSVGCGVLLWPNLSTIALTAGSAPLMEPRQDSQSRTTAGDHRIPIVHYAMSRSSRFNQTLQGNISSG